VLVVLWQEGEGESSGGIIGEEGGKTKKTYPKKDHKKTSGRDHVST
jgi:hypothetical protein